MTGTEIITKFHNMVDDELDSDYELQLLNDAKNEIETMQIWEQLKALDSSQTATLGDTTAVTHNLPTRFALPISLFLGQDHEPYTQINYEDQHRYADISRAFFLDMLNGKFVLTGTVGATETIYFYHTKYSADLAIGDTWAFPPRFHDIIPLKMAQIYYSADAGEKQRAWDDRWGIYYLNRLGQMQTWDAQLKMRAKKGRLNPGGPDPLVALY